MKKNYCRLIAVALTMVLVVASCGDDDPITPTPDPTPDPTPEPTPTVVYNGFGCALTLDSVAGEAEAFNKILLDSMKFYCPELKEIGAWSYGASIVYEKNDTADYVKLRDGFHAFTSSVKVMSKTAKVPVVTSKGTFSTKSQTGVSSDWSYSSSSFAEGKTFGILIPVLNSGTWATDDKKDTGVESLDFSTWSATTIKTMFSGKVVVNGTDVYNAVREGVKLVLFEDGSKIKYGFTIDSSGESLRLTQVGNEELAEEAITTYKSLE